MSNARHIGLKDIPAFGLRDIATELGFAIAALSNAGE
jgi:hypothetical protein